MDLPACRDGKARRGRDREDRIGGIGGDEGACRAIGFARRRGRQAGTNAFSRVKIGPTL
ncbi:hypothetical protein LX76_01883 [Cereibacter changlensis]|uniref:Uncharacterized protein n=1 Tax=Cereibacter changlensis TaxID=402884 RepID=A0A2W7RIK8_9RHOB|nr:hypothetical protein LX76_01883 [Cereibacter changlensis]